MSNSLSRRAFVAGTVAPFVAQSQSSRGGSLQRHIRKHPLAITMWDFSWLERRWPGAGYEDWSLALGELKSRGYDAIRIDAYPHLIAAGAGRTWELMPPWSVQDWGAPARCRVQVQPALNQFIETAAKHGFSVGLSTWFRRDIDDTLTRTVRTPEDLGRVWKTALDSVAEAKLLDRILYVDLCNEWPLDVWAPFYPRGTRRASPEGERWQRAALEVVRAAYPQLDCTFSYTSEYDRATSENVSMLDLLELHIWMVQFSDFYKQVGYNYERFDPKGYDNLALKGKPLYRSDERKWKTALEKGVHFAADWARRARLPLVTTECWSVVDYKDFPLLDWDWVIELCEHGVRTAAATGQWHAMATSNFCGPQFRGMWRDRRWHRRMTDLIHAAPLPALPRTAVG